MLLLDETGEMAKNSISRKDEVAATKQLGWDYNTPLEDGDVIHLNTLQRDQPCNSAQNETTGPCNSAQTETRTFDMTKPVETVKRIFGQEEPTISRSTAINMIKVAQADITALKELGIESTSIAAEIAGLESGIKACVAVIDKT
tara:strand:+ start:9049 stop:9480 length:432 start_codon:yes stop_codon:yes gene_type:complete